MGVQSSAALLGTQHEARRWCTWGSAKSHKGDGYSQRWKPGSELPPHTPNLKVTFLTGLSSSRCRGSLICCLSPTSVTGSHQLLTNTSRTAVTTTPPARKNHFNHFSCHRREKYWLYLFLFWSRVVYSYFKWIHNRKLWFCLTPGFHWTWIESEIINLLMHSLNPSTSVCPFYADWVKYASITAGKQYYNVCSEETEFLRASCMQHSCTALS